MITDLLVENAALVPVAFLLVAVACLGAGHLALRRRGGGARILWVLAALSALPVIALTLVPTAYPADGVVCVVQFMWPTPGRVELLANVVLFFPPALFVTLATGRPLPVLAAGTALSAAVEALQAVVPVIGRACDTNDWAMNTLGTGIAVLAGFGIMRLGTSMHR